MIRLDTFVCALPGLSVEQFNQVWVNDYAPLVATIPRLVRYVKGNLVQGQAPEGLAMTALAQMWLPDLETVKTLEQTSYWQQSPPIRARFADAPKTRALLAEERLVRGGPTGRKLVALVKSADRAATAEQLAARADVRSIAWGIGRDRIADLSFELEPGAPLPEGTVAWAEINASALFAATAT